MTLEIKVSNTEPSGTGTFLYNTSIMDVGFKTKVKLEKEMTAMSKSSVRFIGEDAPEISFDLIVEENADAVVDATLGLVDLDTLRKASVGYDTAAGKYTWIRDTDGEYFLQHWKVGFMSGLNIRPVKGYPNVVGSTLYRVTFKLILVDYEDDEKTLYRW